MTQELNLKINPADGAPFERLLDSDSLVIGRSSNSDLTLPDPFLSRFHARLYREGGDLMVEDLGSRNGTLVNGQTIQAPQKVGAGDEIKVSGSIIQLAAQGEVAEVETSDAPLSDLGATIFRPIQDMLQESTASKDVQSVDGEELRHYAERLKLFNEIHQALSSSLSVEGILELILDRAFEHLKPEQGVIFLSQPDGSYRRAASRNEGTDNEMPLSQSLIDEVCGRAVAALVQDAMTDKRFMESQSIIMAGFRSLIAAPLVAEARVLGMIVLTTRAGAQQFAEGDLEFLVPMASVAAVRIRSAELAKEAAERQRLEEQLALARRIQVNLLPDELPTVEGLEIFAENIPSLQVSGDYYQILERLDGQQCVLLLADVSGKGVPASLITASLEALGAGPIEDGLPPDEICWRISRQLFQRTPPEKYATLFIAIYDLPSHTLTYTNAGHNAALLTSVDGKTRQLGTSGMPVGLLDSATYEKHTLEMAPGDTLLIYTDGLTEAENPGEEEYGIERLQSILEQSRHQPLPELSTSLEKHLNDFAEGVPFHDDRTVVLARRKA